MRFNSVCLSLSVYHPYSFLFFLLLFIIIIAIVIAIITTIIIIITIYISVSVSFVCYAPQQNTNNRALRHGAPLHALHALYIN